jgi:hypothetical protein
MAGHTDAPEGTTERRGHPNLGAAIRAHRGVAVFGSSAVAAFIAYGLAAGRPATISYLFTVGALFVSVAAVDRRAGLSDGLLWALAAWACLHMAGGLIPHGRGVLYNANLHVPALHYDRVVHAFGFGTATLVCWEALRSAMAPGRRMTRGLAVGVALMGMGLGALNETIEFVDTHLHAANVGGYQNTGWDLTFNLIGCAVAAAWIVWRDSNRNHETASSAVAGTAGQLSPGAR